MNMTTSHLQTSLLLALLGELALVDYRSINIATTRLSYSSQEPWIYSSSFRQNILFGSPMDEDKYRQAIDCVALDKVTYIQLHICTIVYYIYIYIYIYLYIIYVIYMIYMIYIYIYIYIYNNI